MMERAYTPIFLLLALFFEALLVRHQSESVEIRYEQFVFLIPFTYAMVDFLLRRNINIRHNVCLWFRQLSILVFLTHQLLILMIYRITGYSMGLLLTFMVVCSSAIVSFFIIKCSSRIKLLHYLY